MKKIALAALGVVMFAGAASAADSGKPVYQALTPPPPPPRIWCGSYIGLNAGWGQNRSDVVYVPPGLPFTGVVDAYSAIGSGAVRQDGFIGGGQLGYNYQWNWFVLGIEADLDYFHTSAGFIATGRPPGNVPLRSLASVSTDWLATVRGRAGVAFQSWFFYLTGGAAATNFNFHQANTYTFAAEVANFSATRWAGVYGAGIEYFFSPNWSVKAEYLHADFGTESRLAPLPNFPGLHLHSANLRTDIVRAGINYHPNWGAPVVAKY